MLSHPIKGSKYPDFPFEGVGGSADAEHEAYYNEAVNYFRGKFLALNKREAMYDHVTCATDTANFQVVFNACKEVILKSLFAHDIGLFEGNHVVDTSDDVDLALTLPDPLAANLSLDAIHDSIRRLSGGQRASLDASFKSFPNRHHLLGARKCVLLCRWLDHAAANDCCGVGRTNGENNSSGVNKLACTLTLPLLPHTLLDFKMSMDRTQLSGLIGTDTVDRLFEFANTSGVFPGADAHRDGAAGDGIFNVVWLRRCCALGERIRLHVDDHGKNQKTMQVPLNEDYEGGMLTFATRQGLACPARPEGSATIHDGTIAHGVSRLASGVRYSLYLRCH